MRRSSIGGLMIAVAFLAANFGVVRFLLSPSRGGRNWHYQLPAGLLPLADSLLLAAYLLLRRNRVSLGRRPREPGRFVLPFAATVALFLATVVLSFFYAQEALAAALRAVAGPVESAFRSMGAEIDMDTPADRYLVGPIFLGVTLSAAPLALALAVAGIWSRFKLIVTPRAEEPCDDSRS